jgi:hypothetical protein
MLTPTGKNDAVIPRVNAPWVPAIKKKSGEKDLMENTPGYTFMSIRA